MSLFSLFAKSTVIPKTETANQQICEVMALIQQAQTITKWLEYFKGSAELSDLALKAHEGQLGSSIALDLELETIFEEFVHQTNLPQSYGNLPQNAKTYLKHKTVRYLLTKFDTVVVVS